MALVLQLALGSAAPVVAQSLVLTQNQPKDLTESPDKDKDKVVWKPGPPGGPQGGYWNVLLAYGEMTDESLNQIMRFQFGEFTGEQVYSIDVGYTLRDTNGLVKFLDPFLTTIDVAFNMTYQDDPEGDIYQFAPYIFARWSQFPWSKYVHTTFGIGDGLSYSSKIPSREFDPGKPDGDYHNVLNYIAVEATLSLPKHEDWQLVYRLHHRSGIFGLMGADNEGTTAIQFGIRHYFD
ncbi:MAG: hypothetical protein R3286_03420 [Gammaproteobacteria bacterium]|nr:hypothetical protein [Gammaproteobacteria bacterium]